MTTEEMDELKRHVVENLKSINFSHGKMSDATRIEISNLKESMKDFKNEFVSFKDEIKKEIKEGFASMDKRFASKLTERIVQGGVAVILLWVLNKALNII